MNNERLGWICCILTCIGSSLNSFNIYPYNIFILLIANIAYTIWGIRLKDNSVSFTVVNIFLLVVNFLGIIHYFNII